MATQTSSKAKKVLVPPGMRPPCSDATRDLLRRKLLENLSPNKASSDEEEGTDCALESSKSDDSSKEDTSAPKKNVKGLKSYRFSLDLHADTKDSARKAQLARRISRQMSSPETPQLVIATTPCDLPSAGVTPTTTSQLLSSQYSRQLSTAEVQSPQNPTHPNRPKIFCVTTTAANLGIDTPPPSADDYLVKPSSAGIVSPTSASVEGNSPLLRQSSCENPLSSQTQSSPPLLQSPPPSATPIKADAGTSLENSSKPKRESTSPHANSIMLPSLKDLIEKTYPKLPTSLTDASQSGGPFLVIECEKLVTLPNLLGPVRPARLVLSGKGHFSFQCLYKELYSGSLSDNLLFSVALKSLTGQSEFRLCMASFIVEGVWGGLSQPHTSSLLQQPKWGESLNQLLESHRCLMWFSPSDHQNMEKEGNSAEKVSESSLLQDTDRGDICKNCHSRIVDLEKVHKQQQQQQQQVGHHQHKQQQKRDSEVKEHTTKGFSSSSTVNPTLSLRARAMGTSPLTIATKSVIHGRLLKSAPVTMENDIDDRSRAHTQNLEVKRHLQETLLARVQRMNSDPQTPLQVEGTSPRVHNFAKRFSSTSAGERSSRKRHKANHSGSSPRKFEESPQKEVAKLEPVLENSTA